MRLSDFDFVLPKERIAQFPLPERSAARMMIVERSAGRIRHGRFLDLPSELSRGDLLIVNDSKVFSARLAGELETGRLLEGLFIRGLGAGEWLVLLRPSRAIRAGAPVRFRAPGLVGRVVRRAGEGEWVVRFPEGMDVESALDRFGKVPIPPYIRREPVKEDRNRYQTVFARERGSVAAPTAGLHFTEELLGSLEAGGIGLATITLHVGPGTFRPIRGESVVDHVVESEAYRLPEETARRVEEARAAGGRVVAVGTTAVRTLETCAEGRLVRPGSGWSDLFLYPPYEPKVVDALLTNFHLPRSSLFVLVCALAGTARMKEAYREAIRKGYRFYSYGDCMLVL